MYTLLGQELAAKVMLQIYRMEHKWFHHIPEDEEVNMVKRTEGGTFFEIEKKDKFCSEIWGNVVWVLAENAKFLI